MNTRLYCKDIQARIPCFFTKRNEVRNIADNFKQNPAGDSFVENTKRKTSNNPFKRKFSNHRSRYR